MIIIEPTSLQRVHARQEAKEMGVLWGSLTKGRGNAIGCMGEILVHEVIGGLRVGKEDRTCDIVLPDGTSIDVKTTQANRPPKPHYVARVYGHEDERNKLATRCDVYYFVRCNAYLTKATVIGWLPASEFFRLADFTPKGSCNPEDTRLAFADEFTVPISRLNEPDQIPTTPSSL